MKSKRNLIILTLVIAISLIGVTYAYFEYYGIGGNQKIVAGKVNLILNEGEDTINRENIFPETVEIARNRTDNFITFTVSGANTSEEQDIWYEIMLNEGATETGMTRFNPGDLVFDLVELDADGNEVTYLIDAMSYNDFNEKRIWVSTVDRNTATEVNKTYKLRMWLSENVLISDSNPAANYKATGYENHYASVKVSVYGDFVEKEMPNYMARLGTTDFGDGNNVFWPDSINGQASNITEVHFVAMEKEMIDEKYNSATIKGDLSNTSVKLGSVKAWLETDTTDATKYIMYVASDGITYFPSNCRAMFRRDFTNLKIVVFENVNTENVTDMGFMFNGCSNLLSLDANNFDTSNVVNMTSVFLNCSSLTSLNISEWNTGAVTNISNIFQNCSGLTSLDISEWNVGMVSTMRNTFNNCSKLTTLNVSEWNTSSVTNMNQMFMGCNLLATLDVTAWNMSNVTDIAYMFSDCSSLTSLDVSDWNTGNVSIANSVFMNCSTLTTLDVSDWNTSNMTRMASMFNGCSNLSSIDVSKWDTKNVTTMNGMFGGCALLTELDLNSFDISSLTNTTRMFANCSSLITIYCDNNWNNGNITSTNMFMGCTNLVGAASFANTSARNITMANPTTGFFTPKTV